MRIVVLVEHSDVKVHCRSCETAIEKPERQRRYLKNIYLPLEEQIKNMLQEPEIVNDLKHRFDS